MSPWAQSKHVCFPMMVDTQTRLRNDTGIFRDAQGRRRPRHYSAGQSKAPAAGKGVFLQRSSFGMRNPATPSNDQTHCSAEIPPGEARTQSLSLWGISCRACEGTWVLWWGSNHRHEAWQAAVPPLNYAPDETQVSGAGGRGGKGGGRARQISLPVSLISQFRIRRSSFDFLTG